jgi:hypothetical protein
MVQSGVRVNAGKVNSLALHIEPNLKTVTGNKPIIILAGIGINQIPSVIP